MKAPGRRPKAAEMLARAIGTALRRSKRNVLKDVYPDSTNGLSNLIAVINGTVTPESAVKKRLQTHQRGGQELAYKSLPTPIKFNTAPFSCPQITNP